MDQVDALNIPKYGPLPYIDKNPKNFFRRTTIAYGPSETGKSVIVRWIMGILAPYIPTVIVICPTDGANEGYKGIVPERCIFTTISTKTLEDIWERQDHATATYNRANEIDVLRSLFMKINDITAINMVRRIENYSSTKTAALDRVTMSTVARKEQLQVITKSTTSALRRIFKSTIRKYTAQLTHRNDITQDERFAIKFIDFNPALLLVMDDCQAQITEWIKSPTIAKLFYQIRHVWGTLLMTMQSDTGKPGLPPGIRGNVFNSFFTEPTVATRFFSNTSNGFTIDDKKNATKIMNEIFKENANGIENYKRFVYSRLDKKSKFRYVIPDDPENLRFGSDALWKLCDGIPNNNKNEITSKFSSCFNIV